MNDMGKQEHKEKKAAVILAAGSGRRMNTPVAKQFLDLMGIPVFLHSVRLFDKIADKIVLVTSPDAVEYCKNLLDKEELCAEAVVIAGKSERFLSSMEGVKAASDCDLIMIHDAARACVDMEVIKRSIASARIHGSGVAAVPLKDTPSPAPSAPVQAPPNKPPAPWQPEKTAGSHFRSTRSADRPPTPPRRPSALKRASSPGC